MQLQLLRLDVTIPFFGNGQTDSLASWKRDPWLVAFTNDEHIVQPGGKGVAEGILDVDNVEGTRVTLPVCHETNTSQVVTSSYHAEISRIKLDEFIDLSRIDADLDRVVDLDERVRVADGTAVASDDAGHALQSNLNFLHLTQLVLRFLRSDPVNCKATLDVVDDTKVFVRLLDTHDVHESSWIGLIAPYFTIDLDQSLIKYPLRLIVCQRVLQTVS